MDAPERPLSPFLIYRWGVTNTLSILHRVTGVGLTLGAIVLCVWLVALATGPEAYQRVAGVLGAPWFRLVLAGVAFSFFYHLGNGVRHLFWDAGVGFSHGAIRGGGVAVVVFAIVATSVYALIGLV